MRNEILEQKIIQAEAQIQDGSFLSDKDALPFLLLRHKDELIAYEKTLKEFYLNMDLKPRK